MQTPILPLGASRRRYGVTGLEQCSFAVPRLVARLRSRNLERHDAWQRIVFVSYMLNTYSMWILLYRPPRLLLAVAPIYVLAGATEDLLLHVYM